MRVTATLIGSAVLTTSIGDNSQSSLALVSPTEVIVSEGSALHRVDITSNIAVRVEFISIESSPYVHIEMSRDKTSMYLVQSSVYKVLMPAFDLQTQYVINGPTGVAEGLDGTTLWVTGTDGLTRFGITSEGAVDTAPYPPGVTSVTAGMCVHESYPDFVFLAGKASAAFGFRKFQVSTRTWSVVTSAISSLNKCTFTPDGNFALLTNLAGTWLYSMAEGTYAKIFTGQVNSVIVNQNTIMLARQSFGVYHLVTRIDDPRNCGPGMFSASRGLTAASQCETCPAGSICPGGANNTLCAPGTFSASTGLRSQGQCSACSAGRYCTGGTAAQLCPLGSYSLATHLTSVFECTVCPAGFYCPNSTAIVVCPSNTMSPRGSSDHGSCTCNAGFRCDVTKVVHAEVTLPITIADFEPLRQAYINAVAAAAGVDPSQVFIVSVTAKAPTGRRLLSVGEFAEVHTSIYGSKHIAKPAAALLTLQRHLVVRGLPPHESNMYVALHHEVTGSKKTLYLGDVRHF
jgi:hypothetical protein